MKTHIQHLKKCLQLAQKAKENGENPVGSIIVKDNEIIAEALEGESSLPKIMGHAENIALLKAQEKIGKDLSDCVLYTTVEPCFMCTYLIRQTKIKTVVYGTTTPAGGHSSAYPILTAKDISSWKNTPRIIGGILTEECQTLLE